MPLPNKSRYTIAEAAKFIKSATGEAVTEAQILDWGTQGLYRLHLAIEHCNIRPIGETENIQVRDSITELRLSSGQAAILGRGERVGVSACWHNGVACNFVRRSTYDSSWRPDSVSFGAAGLVLLGAELAAFTASIAKPPQTAPATDTATPAPVEPLVTASDGTAPLPAVPNWKMLIQAEAAELFLRLLASGANPTPHSLVKPMANWCRDNEIKTDGNINPSEGYIRTHVLGGGHWTPPTMNREQARKHVAQVAQTKVAQVAQ